MISFQIPIVYLRKGKKRAPGRLRQLNICLQLRSWYQNPGIEPHDELPAQRGACFSFSLFPYLCSCSLYFAHSLFRINKILKKKKKRKVEVCEKVCKAILKVIVCRWKTIRTQPPPIVLQNGLTFLSFWLHTQFFWNLMENWFHIFKFIVYNYVI